MNQEATVTRFNCAKYHDYRVYPHHAKFITITIPSRTWYHQQFGGIMKFLVNKPSSVSVVYLTKARYMSEEHTYLSLRPHVQLFSYLFGSE